ncbi:MAG: hypothetical protein HDQ93_03235 [Desulfovibrio sp.]|nr:hypothetical protein [Desulfovibrio sp.]
MSILPVGTPGNWAIYNEDGDAVIPFDTFMGCTVKQEYKVAQDAVERGGFVDYNKVAQPASVGVVLARTGSSSELTEMIETLDALVSSTELVSVITPEKTFVDFTLASYDYDRKTENGVDRLLVSLNFEEIRQVESEYSDEQIPPVKKPKQASDKSNKQAGKQTAEQTKKSKSSRDLLNNKYDSQLARRSNIGK